MVSWQKKRETEIYSVYVEALQNDGYDRIISINNEAEKKKEKENILYIQYIYIFISHLFNWGGSSWFTGCRE